MTKYIIIQLFFVVTIFVSGCNHQLSERIKSIQSFDEVDYEAIKPGSLVIFDVDETLIQPVDTFLINEHTPQGKAFKQKLIQKYPHLEHDNNYVVSVLLQQAQRPLLESSVLHHINKLKNRAVSVIACTAMNTGPYGIHNSLEQWRYHHLKSQGFEGSFNDISFQIPYSNHKPVFYKGLLATDLQPKGPIIEAFIDVMNLTIKDLIMIDDDYDYLLYVEKECDKRKINFQGYEYRGSKSLPWDEELIQFQADYLIKYNKWLNDKAAKDLMSYQKKILM